MSTQDRNPDTRISLREAITRIPGRPHFSTVWRWARRGVLTRSGDRVRLRTWKVGSQLYTTPTEIERFITAITEADDAEYAAQAGEVSELRRRQIEDAEQRCDSAGVSAT